MTGVLAYIQIMIARGARTGFETAKGRLVRKTLTFRDDRGHAQYAALRLRRGPLEVLVLLSIVKTTVVNKNIECNVPLLSCWAIA